MDTSEQYIKMCEKAEEIQPDICPVHMMEARQVFIYDGNDIWFHYAVGDGKNMVIHKVWLPRQDQLQEMVYPRKLNYNDIVNVFHNFCMEYWHTLTSMEQLWLAFVMKEKYGKVWDGERWIS